MALRRPHRRAEGRRAGEMVPELEEALRDSVLLVFGGLATIILVVMAFISVSRPF
jgi:hypothetical protein